MINSPGTFALAVSGAPWRAPDQLERLQQALTAVGLVLDDDARTVMFGIYDQFGPEPAEVAAAARADRNVLWIATNGGRGDEWAQQRAQARAEDLAVDLAVWMTVDPPPLSTRVRLLVPSELRSLRPMLTIAPDTAVEPPRFGEANVSTWFCGANDASGSPPAGAGRARSRDLEPEVDALANGHVAVSVSHWCERWRLDAATRAWAHHLDNVMTSRWAIGPSSCDCCP